MIGYVAWWVLVVFLTMSLSIAIDFSGNSYTKPAAIPMSKDGMSPDKGILKDSGVIAHNVKLTIQEDSNYQPESNALYS